MPNAKSIKARFSELGFSQREVAKQLGIAQPTLSQKINGIRPFFLEEAENLSKILGISDKEFRYYFLDSNLHSAIFDREEPKHERTKSI